MNLLVNKKQKIVAVALALFVVMGLNFTKSQSAQAEPHWVRVPYIIYEVVWNQYLGLYETIPVQHYRDILVP